MHLRIKTQDKNVAIDIQEDDGMFEIVIQIPAYVRTHHWRRRIRMLGRGVLTACFFFVAKIMLIVASTVFEPSSPHYTPTSNENEIEVTRNDMTE